MSFSQKLTRLIDRFYIEPFRSIMSIQKFRYAVCGGVNLVLNWVLFFIFYHYIYDKEIVRVGFITMTPYIATFITVFPITFLTGFWLQDRISFKSSPLRNHARLIRYLVSVSGSVLFNYLLLKLFVEVVGIYATPAQVLTSLILVFYSYFMQKYYSFRGCLDE